MAFFAGAAKVDITPNYNSPTRRWYLKDNSSRIKSFYSPLFARTVAFSDGNQTVTVTSLELAVLYKSHLDYFREVARQLLPVSVDRMFLHCIHQHSDSFIEYEPAYDVFGLNDLAFDLDYIHSLPRKIATSMALAVQNMAPAKVGVGKGAIADGIASCRRVSLPEGSLQWRGSRCTQSLRDLPQGHIDPEVGAMAITGVRGQPIASIYNYACHPSAAGGDSPNCCSADFPGFSSELIEKNWGGISLFLHGCSGDINPGKYVRGDVLAIDDRIGDAQRMGQILGGETLKILGMTHPESVSNFHSILEEGILPVNPTSGNSADCLKIAKKAVAAWRENGADPRLALRKYAISLKISDGNCPVDFGALRFNNTMIACCPGEPFTRLGEQIKAASPADLTLVAATCGEDPFYIPTRDAFQQKGYETTYLAIEETGEQLVDEMGKCMKKVWK